MKLSWCENRRDKRWLWIGVLFLAFYFGEALLFWGPDPRVSAPPYTPLAYWGLFGAVVIWVLTRKGPHGEKPGPFEGVQSVLIGIAIPAAAVGSAFLVIGRTGDVTLGHAVVLIALGQAAVIVGALERSPGWLAAGVCWAASAGGVLGWPALQDMILGAAVAAGFILIGSVRQRLAQPSQGHGEP